MKSKEMKNIPELRFPEFKNEPEWEEKKLSEVSSYVDYRGRAPVKTENGHFLVTARNIKKGFIDYECSKEYVAENDYLNVMSKGLPEVGDVLFTTEAPMGNVALVDNQSIALAQRVIKFRSKKMLLNTYLLHYMLSDVFQQDILNKSIGTTVQGISGKELHQIKLLLPSKPEQQKIADCLSSIDNLITVQSKKVEALKEHKKGLIQQLFPQNGEEVPKLRFSEFENAPKWEKKKLGDIGNVLHGYGFPEKLQGKTEGKYPFYKVSDISNAVQNGNNFIYLSNNYIDEDVLTDLKAKTIPSGVTIFAKIGEAIRSNRRAITTQECLVDNNVSGIKAIAGKATDLYIFYTMSKIDLIEYCGGVVPSINKTALENIQIFCPPTTIEQQKIADCLSSIDELIIVSTKKVETLKEHKKGLMQKLFPSNEVDR